MLKIFQTSVTQSYPEQNSKALSNGTAPLNMRSNAGWVSHNRFRQPIVSNTNYIPYILDLQDPCQLMTDE